MLGAATGPIVAGLLSGLGLRVVFFFNIAVYVLLATAVLRYRRLWAKPTPQSKVAIWREELISRLFFGSNIG